jgi:hypothetical protein
MATPKTTGSLEPNAVTPQAPVEPAREKNHPDEPKSPPPTATSDKDAPRVVPPETDFGKPEPTQLPSEHKRPSREEFAKAGNDPKEYDARVADWEDVLKKHIAVGHKYGDVVKRLPSPLVKREPPPSPRLREGMVRVKAVKTVLAHGMPFQAGDVFTMPKDQAERLQSKGSLKIVKS